MTKELTRVGFGISEALAKIWKRETGLKKNIILTGGFFIMKTVYIEI